MKRMPAKELLSQKGAVINVHAVACDYFDGSEKAVRQRVARRTIPFRHDGGRIVFFRDELERFFRGLPGVMPDEAIANMAKREESSG